MATMIIIIITTMIIHIMVMYTYITMAMIIHLLIYNNDYIDNK